MVLPAPLFQLQCEVNEYEWGKIGKDSKAARFALSTEEAKFDLKDDKPYAELWMGTHSSAPSRVLPSQTLLSQVLDDNAELCGKEISDAYEGKLPFLFKVLSIQKALSIQCHPTKELAKKLHKDDPKNYKDDNHKPEMAIAITPFEGFCGFRPIKEIVSFLDNVGPFASLLGQEAVTSFKESVQGKEDGRDEQTVNSNREALKELFSVLMNKDEADVKKAADSLIESAKSNSKTFGGKDYGGEFLSELLVRLNSQFPQDIGLFCSFYLNYVTLQPGESLFLRALDCHAYLSGDIMECMAASDNVVRAGFTPKFKDVKNLTEMLTYAYAPPADQKMKPEEWDRGSGQGKSILYDPPIDEFSVVQTTIEANDSETHHGVKGPSIIISTTGDGRFTVGNSTLDVREGQVFFVGANAELKIESGRDSKMVTYRAFVEVEDDRHNKKPKI
ncbi:Mannose-6-phosphate isomerase [Taphrina deformans PYCC 5710]|uniref:Mannose-6-phosphate isomerase n=1 Tax=Taphrina deformans (strain PYCC 5710 / ATCC 11124 / CBS 356.35 / IMI 108563 / JCM 9778 / NBRC 8474) TaxID=1097556 RepID=R4X9S8_TAPDE|nr:Mannose-6-phosphate isomerase [Taphrina deformans PYCC 5710]|eukprot:CCG82227.1 Mannose-6-phosphate isomerase [Taphrina deformans PYCC 5710]